MVGLQPLPAPAREMIQTARENLTLLEQQLLNNDRTNGDANLLAVISSLTTLEATVALATNVSTL